MAWRPADQIISVAVFIGTFRAIKKQPYRIVLPTLSTGERTSSPGNLPFLPKTCA